MTEGPEWKTVFAEPLLMVFAPRACHSDQEIAEAPILVPLKAVVNLARKVLQAVRRKLLPRAAEVLAHFEALGLVMGMETPGLRSVIDAAVRGRSRIATFARPAIPEFVKVTS